MFLELDCSDGGSAERNYSKAVTSMLLIYGPQTEAGN